MLKSTLAMEQQLRDSSLLRQKVENAWLQAQQPVELSPGVFLLMHPEKVRLPPLRSNGKELLITPEIQVPPQPHPGHPRLRSRTCPCPRWTCRPARCSRASACGWRRPWVSTRPPPSLTSS